MTHPPVTSIDPKAFAADGLVFPLSVLSPGDAQHTLEQFETLEAKRAGRFPDAWNVKPQLLFPWIWDMVQAPEIVDPVAEILGPDLLCWGVNFFAKSPGDAKHVAWHQDATYWGLSEPRAVTAWLALTPSNLSNGCLQVVPGSHHKPVEHNQTDDRTNMLPAREEISVDVDPGSAVAIELEPGQMSIHHLLSVHGSTANTGTQRRVGLAIRYIAGDLHQTGDQRGSATLVRGKNHDTFDLEHRPAAPLDPEARKHHDAVIRKWARMVFSDTQFQKKDFNTQSNKEDSAK